MGSGCALHGGLLASAREALPHEADTDFAEHNRQWEGAVSAASFRLYAEMADWRAQIKAQITAGMDTPGELAHMTVETKDAALILRQAMEDLAQRAGLALQRQAEQQGVTVPEWDLPADTEPDDDSLTAAVGGRKLLDSVAQLTAELMATSVVQTAKRVVTGLVTRSSTPEQIATEVDRVLIEGQESTVKGPVGTAMSTAQTAGREAVLKVAPVGDYYASEMLDRNTCAPCKLVDGEQFATLDVAIKAYPVMGYRDCVGPKYGNSCRGMIVASWRPSETASAFHGSPGDPGYDILHPNSKAGRAKSTGETPDTIVEPDGRVLALQKRPDKDGGAYYEPDFSEIEDPDEAEEAYDTDSEHVNRFMDYSAAGFAWELTPWMRTGELVEDGAFDEDDLNEMLDTLKYIASTRRLAKATPVYRIAPASHYDTDVEDGDIVMDPAVLSTTVNKSVTDQYRTKDDDVVIRVEIPAGAPIMPNAGMGGGADGEIMIPGNVPMRRVGWDGDVLVYEYVDVPDARTAAAFHGTPGEPGYPAKHPGGARKGNTQTPQGGQLGSDSFTEEEHKASAEEYLAEAWSINHWLRNREAPDGTYMDEEELEDHAKRLMDLIEIQEPSTEEQVFYRGLTDSFAYRKQLKRGARQFQKGMEFYDEGFGSTSSDRKVAEKFMGGTGEDSQGFLLKIVAPPGTKTLNMRKIVGPGMTQEDVLQSGTRFRVVRFEPRPVEESWLPPVIEVEIIPS